MRVRADRSTWHDGTLIGAADSVISANEVVGLPLLVLANKQDLDSAKSVEAIKAVFNESATKVNTPYCKVVPVSAVHGDGIMDGVSWLVDRIKRNAPRRPPQQQDIR